MADSPSNTTWASRLAGRVVQAFLPIGLINELPAQLLIG
jgi:hypothetical protein